MNNSAKEYDVIIIGAGLSGLTLTNEIIKNLKKCLDFRKKKKFSNDKNWCFWNIPENPFTKYTDNIWNKIVIKLTSKKRT